MEHDWFKLRENTWDEYGDWDVWSCRNCGTQVQVFNEQNHLDECSEAPPCAEIQMLEVMRS